jgi:dethiobiotin synthetase
MQKKYFITGTDTEIGKTYISVGLLKAFYALGYSTLGIKPVASGCYRKGEHLFNEDALALQQASSLKLDYTHINPFAFEPAIAPHIAAARINAIISIDRINEKLNYALHYPADMIIIEGVGGWFTPLNQQETMADWVKHWNLPIILVVGIRLGCINHAILTARAIQATSLSFAGWVANVTIIDYAENQEIIATLKEYLPAPFLGMVQFQQAPERMLDVKLLV